MTKSCLRKSTPIVTMKSGLKGSSQYLSSKELFPLACVPSSNILTICVGSREGARFDSFRGLLMVASLLVCSDYYGRIIFSVLFLCLILCWICVLLVQRLRSDEKIRTAQTSPGHALAPRPKRWRERRT